MIQKTRKAVTINLEAELFDQAQQLAEADNKRLSGLITLLLKNYVNRQLKKEKSENTTTLKR